MTIHSVYISEYVRLRNAMICCSLNLYIHQFALEPTQWQGPSNLSSFQCYVLFFCENYDVSFRRVRQLRTTNLHSWLLTMSCGIISILMCNWTLWHFQCKNLFGKLTILYCLQHRLHLYVPIVTMLSYNMFNCLSLLPRSNYWASAAGTLKFSSEGYLHRWFMTGIVSKYQNFCNCKLVRKIYSRCNFHEHSSDVSTSNTLYEM